MLAQIWGGFLGSGGLAWLIGKYKRRLVQNFVLRIDFDAKNEVFKVTVPPDSFRYLGEPQKISVNAADFQMLT